MKQSALVSGISRRHFLATAGLALAAPTIIPASALGREDQPAPSKRITMGVVGWGMMGPGNTDAFLGMKDCQVVAACDLDTNHLKQALDKINGHYKNQDCKPYHDYRDMMARTDIDAVMIAVPDHWHAMLATEAAKHKKDIYGEKPLARTIAEQQAIVKAVQKNKRIWQTGSWQRSQAPFRKAAEIVRNGLIGKVTRVEVGLPEGHSDFAGTKNKMSITPPPANLDYPFWIGPSKMEPYIEGRVHMNWRWNYNTGGGQLLDWIGHHCDIAHWGMNMDNGGPSEIEGQGEFPPSDAVWNTCTQYLIPMIIARHARRADGPRPDAHLDAVDAQRDEFLGAFVGGHVAGEQLHLGELALDALHGVHDARAMAVRGIDGDYVHLARDQFLRAFHKIAGGADGRADAQASLAVLGGIRVL